MTRWIDRACLVVCVGTSTRVPPNFFIFGGIQIDVAGTDGGIHHKRPKERN